MANCKTSPVDRTNSNYRELILVPKLGVETRATVPSLALRRGPPRPAREVGHVVFIFLALVNRL